MYGSYNGKILHINLTDKKVDVEEPSEFFYRRYMGGRNFIGYYLLKYLPQGVDPLSPDNMLIFAASVLTGLPVGGLGRHSVGAKSPVSGGWADSEVGGFWGVELKAAGYDAIVIKGKSVKPVYLWIHDGEVEIRSAEYLWGKTTAEADMLIKNELGDEKVKISQIGPAGENLVQFACIMADLHYAAGRNGLGAVMGSKNLKALAVRGSHKPEGKHPDKVKAFAKKFAKGWKENRERLALHGTAAGAISLHGTGQIPTRNFNTGVFEGTEKISGERMTETILIGREGCYACSIRCKRIVEAENNERKADPLYGGPEYETVAAFGSNLCNDDLRSIAVANAMCNANGIDTISAGMSIAFLTECFEKGFIDSKKTDGLQLKFGDTKIILHLLEKIIKREGVGDILASGLKATLDYVGIEAEECALHVKGQYIALHDPRAKHGVGLGYATAPGGADHLQASHDPNFTAEGKIMEAIYPFGDYEPIPSCSLNGRKVSFFFHSSLWISVLNVLDICWYVASPPAVFSQEDVIEIVRAATGWNVSLWELMKAGERGLTMARLFNNKNGVDITQDTLPKRFFTPMPEGPLKGARVDKQEFEKAKKTYYEMMGWDPCTGEPSFGRLVELDLEWALGKIEGESFS